MTQTRTMYDSNSHYVRVLESPENLLAPTLKHL